MGSSILDRKRNALEAQIITMRNDFETEESEVYKMIETEQEILKQKKLDKIEMAESRKADFENIKNHQQEKLKGEFNETRERKFR